MTKCRNCDIVDLGINRVNKFGEMYELCPNCGMEDVVEEVSELAWAEEMIESEGYEKN